MSVDANFFKTTISSVLRRNPTLRNPALSGVLAANIADFKGSIQVSDDKLYSFHSNGYESIQKPAKIIYLSPYAGIWRNLLISIKRIFAGAAFGPSPNGDLRSYLAQGRRITVYCSLDGSEAEVLIERDREPLFRRIYKAVFALCI